MSGSGGSDVYTFNYTGTIETFIVPQTGTYFIAAFGAPGGGASLQDPGGGGSGGDAAGNFALVQGSTLEIAVGSPGGLGDAAPHTGGGEGGGGGGSFVVLDQGGTLTPLVVAGGGGGAGGGGEGGATVGGDGQGGTYDVNFDGGGGGFYGDGQPSTASTSSFGSFGGFLTTSTGGKSFLDGLAGGTGGTEQLIPEEDYIDGGPGGFGGGGGGGPDDGGGGGGFTGGNAGQGGSSYVSPDAVGNPILIAGGNAAGSGEVLIEYPACFLKGTRLAGPSGLVRVETLRPGDLLWSHRRACAVPVTWVGQRRFDCARHPKPKAVLPVRIRAGAFGPGLPARDLLLSPDHAFFFRRVLIPVRVLIDGCNLVQQGARTVTYWHVALDQHDVVLAEGLPVETFLDTGGRAAFDGGMIRQLYPDFAARTREAEACAPLRLVGPEVDAAVALLQQARVSAAAV